MILLENSASSKLIAFKIIWQVMKSHFPCQRQSILETFLQNKCIMFTKDVQHATYYYSQNQLVSILQVLSKEVSFAARSCCEHCQNFEAVIHEMAKYMIGIPCTLADCVDSSMCPYNSYFPKMDCVLQIVKTVSHKN